MVISSLDQQLASLFWSINPIQVNTGVMILFPEGLGHPGMTSGTQGRLPGGQCLHGFFPCTAAGCPLKAALDTYQVGVSLGFVNTGTHL